MRRVHTHGPGAHRLWIARRHGIGRLTALVTLLLASVAVLGALAAGAAAEACSNAAFRAGPSAHLPDCRAYELVTPSYKASAAVQRVYALSSGGSPLLLGVDGAFGGAEGFPNVIGFAPQVVYTTQRTASGWISVPDDPPSSEYLPYLEDGFDDFGGEGGESPDGKATVWMGRGAWQPGNSLDFFEREPGPERSIVDVGPALPPTAPSESPTSLGAGAELHGLNQSPDGAHYFFYINRNEYWPFDSTVNGHPSLYEYLGSGNTTPLLVGVADNGALVSQCGIELGGSSLNNRTDSADNAVSANGNTVFFTASPAGGECNGSGPPVKELYARVDNGLSGAHTVAISEPSQEDCATCDTEAKVLANAHFEGAATDGSKVVFTTTQPLLGGDTSTNVYEYDFDAPPGERVIRVSAGDATVSSPTAEVVQINGRSPMISEDGSHVYFIAKGLLTRTPNGEGETAEAGADNLYVFERDARFPAGRTAFVARLSSRDVSTTGEVNTGAGQEWSPDLTPDGRFCVFASERDLTPDDTSTARQIFEYDAQSGSLVRVSVGQEGFNHNGNASAMLSHFDGEALNGASIVSPSSYFERYYPSAYSTHLSVSADGSYVFFQSTVGLTPQAFNQELIADENGEPVYANNVYEYHQGHVSLISDGDDIASVGGVSIVELLGTDESGEDVLFSTADRLVGQDTDTDLDIYDARIDGGFPAPAQPLSCSGDACQGALSAAPTLLSPSSEFQAGGNPPLAAEAAAKPAQKKAKKQRSKKAKPKKAGKGRTGRGRGRARKATAAGDTNRKVGRS